MLSDAKAINKPNKLNKETNPSISPQGETRKGSAEFFFADLPEYTLNKQTHNYDGLNKELKILKGTEVKEDNATMENSDFGRLKGEIRKIVYDSNNAQPAPKNLFGLRKRTDYRNGSFLV